jgi:hypothetical protein
MLGQEHKELVLHHSTCKKEFQAELSSPKCIGETEFDYKYHELVYLILNLALFILNT